MEMKPTVIVITKGPLQDWVENKEPKYKSNPQKFNFDSFVDANCFPPKSVKFYRCTLPAAKASKKQKDEEEQKATVAFTATKEAIDWIIKENGGVVQHTTSGHHTPKILMEGNAKQDRPAPLREIPPEKLDTLFIHHG